MIYVLGDLIADFSMRIPSFPVKARDLRHLDYLELGPGGSTNVAIVCARLGMEVGCLGEVGDDPFGRAILDGMELEGIDASGVIVSEQAQTPVAGVLVDEAAEPAYLGFRGHLTQQSLTEDWKDGIASATALFCDGWADQIFIPDLILEALDFASSKDIPTFFDPGPGNPEFDLAWHKDAASKATVFMATAEEAYRVTGHIDPVASARAMVKNGSSMAVIKRGPRGAVLVTEDAVEISPAYPVGVVDVTGAGDSFDATVIYGFHHQFSLAELGILGNAAGAAKIRKQGTGHNLPTRAEINFILERFGKKLDLSA